MTEELSSECHELAASWAEAKVEAEAYESEAEIHAALGFRV